jgi:PDZ domain-containing protein
MSRRSSAILLGALLVLLLTALTIRSPVPFVTLEPGPTLDVLSREAGKPVVRVKDRRTYETSGALRLVTVSESTAEHRVGLLEAVNAWWRPSMTLIPRELVFPGETTNQDERAASAAQMVSSQDTAVAAALTELGYELETYPLVSGITPGGPADGELEVRDRLVSIGGITTDDVDEVFEAVKQVEPGDPVVVEVRRKGALERATLETVPNPEDPERAMIGIFPGTGYRFPFDVGVGIGSSIGGPSAGLVFALAIYDALTPGGLTGGRDIAGTGTIDPEGKVGGIGGVQQKILGARRDGATLFLLPPDNCDAALAAPVDPDEIALVPTATLDAAITAVRNHAEDPDADLPRCTDES